jgi:sulfoacetaldehyde dehydrogenase
MMSDQTDTEIVDGLVERARVAQEAYAEGATQKRYDRAAQAVAWAVMEPSRNAELAELAVSTTGLGNIADKVTKNHRKTLGLMRDISKVTTCGVISDETDRGITRIARPIGVVGAVVPSTNPVATPANNIINAVKCGNAIVLSPSPKGIDACARLLHYIHLEFDKLRLSRDLVQMIPPPGTKGRTQRMLEIVDLVIVTGSQDNVRRAYSSGTPAIGVGAGNATVIVDETADIGDTARKIAASKTFDNATSCSSENAIIVVDSVADTLVAALEEYGGATVSMDMEPSIVGRLWPDGRLNPLALAKDADILIDVMGLRDSVADNTRFIIVPTDGVGPGHPLSGEKLSLVVSLYRVADFDSAKTLARRILSFQGAGHSIGIHTNIGDRALSLGHELPTCRVIVNQAHCFATGGAFNNGLPFSLSMGCGSWGGNSIDENLHWKHFLNITKVVREIDTDEPAVDDIFEDYWAECGK